MAMLAPCASSFATKKFTCHLTNSALFKSHFIKNYLEPPSCQCQSRTFFMLTQNALHLYRRSTTRFSFKLHLLLPLSLGPSSSLPFCFGSVLPCSPLHKFHSPLFSSPMSSLNSDANPVAKTVRAVIKGRVQGVFYRDWTVENAKELGLKGWVRNRRDGTVEALFSGSPEKVQEMEQRCRRGPPSAIVTGLDVFPCDDDPGTGFERKQTA
ncbi:uncharacterized protein LOC132630009 [Lycium barbarum]|uniref:uncharacterized protein LOC132630009 n=1 Tax=Lycium barbarum TaxID=112863 RepID=UPI00293E5A4A|nr:uncharacterized protein LOC132630009 [Lycium barbarum]